MLTVTPVSLRHADAIAGIPIDFVLFALTLLGVALFHHHTLKVAVTGNHSPMFIALSRSSS